MRRHVAAVAGVGALLAGGLLAAPVARAVPAGDDSGTRTVRTLTVCIGASGYMRYDPGADSCGDQELRLRVVGMRGPRGATGPQGDTGATGAQGPKGDIGATGPQGPKGDTGANGTNGVSGWEQVSIGPVDDPTIANLEEIGGTAQCPDGKKMLGGGFSTTNMSGALTTTQNGPEAGRESTDWTVKLANFTGSNQSIVGFTVFVNCATVA